MVQFRKSKKFGAARFTVSKRGLSSSVGGGPFRLSFGADGRVRRTIRAPGVGLWDTKTVGAGGRRKRRQGGGGHPFLKLVGFLILAGVLWSACSPDRAKEPQSQQQKSSAVPLAGAPTTGAFPSWTVEDPVPFGQTSPPARGAFPDYTFLIDTPPELTTSDAGKTVRMASKVRVNRVASKDDDEPLAKALNVIFRPGVTSDLYSMDESHGADVDVSCAQDRLAVGQSTDCTLSFTAPASEIKDSYWSINNAAMGAWPGQVALTPES